MSITPSIPSEMKKPANELEKRKRFLKREIERIKKIPPEAVLVEVLPFLESYAASLRDELRAYEDKNA